MRAEFNRSSARPSSWKKTSRSSQGGVLALHIILTCCTCLISPSCSHRDEHRTSATKHPSYGHWSDISQQTPWYGATISRPGAGTHQVWQYSKSATCIYANNYVRQCWFPRQPRTAAAAPASCDHVTSLFVQTTMILGKWTETVPRPLFFDSTPTQTSAYFHCT